jgi:hypothetical protein
MGSVFSVESEVGNQVFCRQNGEAVVSPEGKEPLKIPGIHTADVTINQVKSILPMLNRSRVPKDIE